ncbi:MAG: DUF3306 domain-containing protein [Candidatus Thiodiazotropha sp. 6PLUC2]
MDRDEKSLDEEKSNQGDGFYSRWSERKLASQQPLVAEAPTVEEPQPSDEDMPPLESLNEESDYSGFLSPKVSEQLRQLALRKLFHGAAFNVCDGLDDYAEDFTQFEALGDVITADLRHQMELEAERKREEEVAESEDQPQPKQTQSTGATESEQEEAPQDVVSSEERLSGESGRDDDINQETPS